MSGSRPDFFSLRSATVATPHSRSSNNLLILLCPAWRFRGPEHDAAAEPAKPSYAAFVSPDQIQSSPFVIVMTNAGRRDNLTINKTYTGGLACQRQWSDRARTQPAAHQRKWSTSPLSERDLPAFISCSVCASRAFPSCCWRKQATS